ncbi:MAG: HNH endonuclease [Micrococcales bacterium]|nr:HNH endonuclease [Micrococcales bacterium]
MGQEALPRLRESLADAERLLATRGDTTKLTVSQLPSKGGRITERESVWWIPSNDWEASVETPIRIAATAEHIKYYSAGSDIGTDDDDDEPVLFILWIVEGKVFLANDDDLTPGDVKALVNQQKSTRRLALEKAHALQAMTEQLDKPRRRGRIPQEVRIEVWQHDQGRCVECKSQNDLEFDHIIPFGMGGSNTARNLQLLCGSCNRVKGMTLG